MRIWYLISILRKKKSLEICEGGSGGVEECVKEITMPRRGEDKRRAMSSTVTNCSGEYCPRLNMSFYGSFKRANLSQGKGTEMRGTDLV